MDAHFLLESWFQLLHLHVLLNIKTNSFLFSVLDLLEQTYYNFPIIQPWTKNNYQQDASGKCVFACT